MKPIVKNHSHSQPQRILLVVLIGILSLSSGLMLLDSAVAAPEIRPAQEAVNGRGDRVNQLPARLANAVRLDLSHQVGIPPEKLRITESTRKTWPDGCLGLPRPDELCTQALVQGWRITLSNGHQTWVYRTDLQGRGLRLETG